MFEAMPSRRKSASKRKPRTYHSNEPLPDAVQAAIWVHYEETASLRLTADRLDIAASTVAKYLRANPIKLQDLIAAKRDERAMRWRELEEKSLNAAVDTLDRMVKATEQVAASKRKGLMIEDKARVFKDALSVLRGLAAESAKNTQLLTGGATDRIDAGSGTGGPAGYTDQQLIDMANGLGAGALVLLPPGLLERMNKAKQNGSESTVI